MTRQTTNSGHLRDLSMTLADCLSRFVHSLIYQRRIEQYYDVTVGSDNVKSADNAACRFGDTNISLWSALMTYGRFRGAAIRPIFYTELTRHMARLAYYGHLAQIDESLKIRETGGDVDICEVFKPALYTELYSNLASLTYCPLP
ncbi:hypothetical protein RRG08_011582 [Elysia crispata]|uniref:Uncharacterized protein n=1 Tax=Elysia crispata TaxID=231223 RepID=A0AAE0XNZ0_9GAST|nr:hypothetical protein RRG08_011582 [Elysia crispata]